jgi:hypothetical protein
MSTKPLKMLLACAVLLALSVISVAANPGYNRERRETMQILAASVAVHPITAVSATTARTSSPKC